MKYIKLFLSQAYLNIKIVPHLNSLSKDVLNETQTPNEFLISLNTVV